VNRPGESGGWLLSGRACFAEAPQRLAK